MRGTCLCGRVEFKILTPVTKLYQCHCSLCRKQSGSASNTATFVGNDELKWLSQMDGISSWVKDTGFRSDFCSTCGSPVPNPFKIGSASYWWIPAGLLESNLEAQIVAHVNISSKAAWDELLGVSYSYEAMPNFMEFFEVLHPSIKSK